MLEWIIWILISIYFMGFWAGIGLVIDKYVLLHQENKEAAQAYTDAANANPYSPFQRTTAYKEYLAVNTAYYEECKRWPQNIAYYAGLSWYGVYMYVTEPTVSAPHDEEI